jgi:hypothetical protein
MQVELEKLYQIYNDNKELAFQLAKANGCERDFIDYLWDKNRVIVNLISYDFYVEIYSSNNPIFIYNYHNSEKKFNVYTRYIDMYYETLDEAIDHILKLIYET